MSSCLHCGQPGLQEWPEFGRLHRITSDCRPWGAGGQLGICTTCAAVQKPVTEHWHEECGRIYGHYHAYHQGKGADQRVFLSGGAGLARSKAFLALVLAGIPPTATGRLLDVGCGNGNLLAEMSRLHPRWRLAGADLGEDHRAEIEAIPNVEWFHSTGWEDLTGSFDLVTVVHLLEHLDQPVQCLKALALCLAPGGRLAIEVPNLRTNPFDLVITDHCSHYTAASLHRVLAASGLRSQILEDSIPREITAIARGLEDADSPSGFLDGTEPSKSEKVEEVRVLVEHHLDWLSALLKLARESASHGSKLAIMGSSIAAGWVAGELDGLVDVFIDEDPDRIGGSFLGLLILAPEKLPKNVPLLLPMTPATAVGVAARMTALGLHVILPPPW